MAFLTPEQKGISKEEKKKILDRLLVEEKPSNCPDCGVKSGEKHLDGCDVERCIECGSQRIQCDCDCEHDVWIGLWPGVKECQELELICWDTATNSWMYDLNELCRIKMRNK